MITEVDTRNPVSNHYYYLWMGLILFLALGMRLYHLDFSYSNDELSALSRTVFTSFTDLINKGVKVDFHPAGVQVFLYYWVKLFGMDEWVIRLPFALAGTAAIGLAILTFNRWFGWQSGLLTGALLTFTELPLLFSQIARPYGSGLLLSMLTVFFWTLFLQRDKPRFGYALGFALSAAACLYNHHFSGLFAFMVGIAGFFTIRRTHFKLYLAAGILTALLYLPHFSITFVQMSIGGVGEWLGKPSWSWPLEHFSRLFNYSLIIPALIIVTGIFQWKYYQVYKDASRFRLLALIFFTVPLLIGFFYSIFVNPILQHSIMLFSTPFLFAILFSWSYGIPVKIFNILLPLLLIAGTFQTIIINKYYSAQHFGEFRGIAEKVKDWNNEYGEDSITRAMNINNPWYLNFYLREDSTTFVQSENLGGADLQQLSLLLNNSKTNYFMYAWLKPTPAGISDMILARFPCTAQTADFSGMTKAVLYTKNDKNCLQHLTDTVFFQKDTFPESSPDKVNSHFLEYYPGFQGILSVNEKDKSVNVQVGVEALSETIETGSLLAFSVHNADKQTIFWKASKLSYFIKENEWSRVLLSFDIPVKTLSGNTIKVYLWNPGLEPLFIRNMFLGKGISPTSKNENNNGQY